jgi:hypothetical protein
MLNRFMITAATVALIAGTGFANAEGTGSNPGSTGGSAVQSQTPTGSSAAPAATEPNKPSGMKATQSEDKMQGSKNQRAQDDMKAGAKGEKSAQDNVKGETKGEKSKSMSSENDNAKDNAKGGTKDMKAEGREDRNGMKAEGREDRNGMNAETKGAEGKSQTTVGQAGAGAKLSTEQRTKITTVIRSQHVAPVEHVNFSISVGTRVPRDVRFYPLPTEVVTIYPEWRGYEFILVGEQVVVVDPRTFEIVAVLEA